MEAVRPSGRELAFRFGDPRFKTHSDHSIVVFDPGISWFNFSATLVNNQLVCLRVVGILQSQLVFMFCSVVSFR